MNITDRLNRWLFENADCELPRAISENDPDRVSALLAQGANANLRGRQGQTPLFLAAADRLRDRAIAEQLLARGADVNIRDHKGRTPLHVAADANNEDYIKLFLDRGAEIDARDARGRTPLHYAASYCGIEAASYLVGRGADVSIRDHKGRTPLDFARETPELDPLLAQRQEMHERLLGGFMTARIVEAQPDALVVRVETVHWTFLEADRRATEQGTLIVPCGAFRNAPAPGDFVWCYKGLLPSLDEAWSNAYQRDVGIERER